MLPRPRPRILAAVAMQPWGGKVLPRASIFKIYLSCFSLSCLTPPPHTSTLAGCRRTHIASPAVVQENYTIRKEEGGEADRGTEEDREVASDSCGQGSPGEMGN